MAQLDYILQAFTCFIDGVGKAGTGEKCQLPKIKKKTEKFRGGGMLAEREVALGIEAMTHEMDLSAIDPQVIAKAGLYVGKDVSYSTRGYLDGDGGAKHTLIQQMRGEIIELDFGTWEAGKKAMLKTKVALTAAKLTIDADALYDMDVENDVYDFAKTNVYGDIRAALGL